MQRWLAASDGDATVVLSPLDTPLVTLGGMTASTWPRQLSLKRAHVFAYVMNNYWYTNYKASQGGRQVFRFSLTSSRGGFLQTRRCEQGLGNVLATRCATLPDRAQASALGLGQRLISVKPAGLPLMAFKQAEDENGFILRVCDLAGTGGPITLTLPKPVSEAARCDLVEANPVKARARGQTVTVPVKKWGLATVKVSFAP